MTQIKPVIIEKLNDKVYEGKFKFADCATIIGTLKDKSYGETVQFPVWDDIGDAEIYKKGDITKPEEMSQSFRDCKIDMFTKSVTVYDYELATSIGDKHVETAGNRIERKIRQKENEKIAEECIEHGMKVKAQAKTTITEQDCKNSFAMYGDDRDAEDFCGIISNSQLTDSWDKMEGFRDATKTDSISGNGIARQGGLYGYYKGTPVWLCDEGTFDKKNNECITYFIKKGSIGIMPKYDPAKRTSGIAIVTEREEKAFRTDIIGSKLFATRLINEQGVVVLKNTIA